jgi:hypothetical protein
LQVVEGHFIRPAIGIQFCLMLAPIVAAEHQDAASTEAAHRLFGDEINIAVRLEGIADPGGIRASSAVIAQHRPALQRAVTSTIIRDVRASRQTMPIWNRMPLTLHQPCARTVGLSFLDTVSRRQEAVTVLEPTPVTAFCRGDIRWTAQQAAGAHARRRGIAIKAAVRPLGSLHAVNRLRRSGRRSFDALTGVVDFDAVVTGTRGQRVVMSKNSTVTCCPPR